MEKPIAIAMGFFYQQRLSTQSDYAHRSQKQPTMQYPAGPQL